jgi:glycosyltransferase involved in cell wall biosynthesis
LFIGSFLSEIKGTKGVSESLKENLVIQNFDILLSSKYENRFLRIIDIIFSILLFRGKKIHIDVFSGPAFLIAEIATHLAALRKKNIIITLHGGKLIEFSQNNSWRVSRVLNRASVTQTPSLFLKEYFENVGFEIKYIPNSIDISKFPFKRDSVTPFTLLWVRAFSSIYNPEIAINILYQLLAKYPYAKLTMIGPDKGIKKDMMELVDKLGIKTSVEFVGSVSNDELYKFYQSHKVFLNTTSYESFGVAVLEAASCGIPIVSNTIGEIPYLWENEKDILLVNDNNLNEYLNHIINIFENDSLSNKISKNARQKAERFDWEMLKNTWLKILN